MCHSFSFSHIYISCRRAKPKMLDNKAIFEISEFTIYAIMHSDLMLTTSMQANTVIRFSMIYNMILYLGNIKLSVRFIHVESKTYRGSDCILHNHGITNRSEAAHIFHEMFIFRNFTRNQYFDPTFGICMSMNQQGFISHPLEYTS